MAAALVLDTQTLVIPRRYIYIVLLDSKPVYVGCSDQPERIGSTLVQIRNKAGDALHGRVSIKVVDFTHLPRIETGGRGNLLTNVENLLIAMHAWQTGSFHYNGIQRGGTKKGGWIENEEAMKTLMGIYSGLGLPVHPKYEEVMASLEWDKIEKKRGREKRLAVYAESVAEFNPQSLGLRFAHCTKQKTGAPHLTSNSPALVCTVTCGNSPKIGYP